MLRKKLLSEIFNSKLFWIGLALKLVLMCFLASRFLTDLFLPFIDFYINSGFVDPYNHFFIAGKMDAFPYPVAMLWLLSIPYYLAYPFIVSFNSISPFLSIFILRISILLADFVILIILTRWLKYNLNKLLIFYWLSPVLIYISYIHGQLDAIPIAVLLVSLYFLFKEKFIIAAVILAIAVSCKTNILIAVPFFFIFLFAKGVGFKDIASCALAFISSLLLVNLPYLSSDGFIHMVLLNSKQSQIFNAFYGFTSDRLFYFIPAIYFILLVKAFMIKGYNRDIFIMFLGFSFGVLNLFIPPMQGWYYWVIPFFAYFYIKEKEAPYFLFFTLQICYFIYFLVVDNSDYLEVIQLVAPQISSAKNLYFYMSANGVSMDKIIDLAFTILQVSLLLNCVWIYRSGITNYLKHKLVSKPYLIGISGDSGVGKTTLVNSILDVFGRGNITAVCGDDMHKWERGHEKWQEFTHLNPSANKLHSEVAFLRALKQGQKIFRRAYDHSNGKFTEPKKVAAKKIIIFEGLHSFYVESVRNLFDIKIFVKPEENLRLHWKIIRDQEKRGWTKEEVLKQLEKRKMDSEKFISSQEKYADVTIELFSANEIKNIGNKNEKITLNLKISFSNKIDMEPFIEEVLKIESLKIEHDFNCDEQSIKVAGSAAASDVKSCGEILLGHNFEEINLQEPEWSSDLVGFMQLLLAFYIIQTELV